MGIITYLPYEVAIKIMLIDVMLTCIKDSAQHILNNYIHSCYRLVVIILVPSILLNHVIK